MDILGAVSATADLLGLTIKASKAAKSLVHSFQNAPAELVDLAAKLSLLRLSLEQIQGLCQDLDSTSASSRSAAAPSPTSLLLLPPEQREVLHFSLKTSLDALQNIKSLCNTDEGDDVPGKAGKRPISLRDVKHRARWAVVDKRKAARILEDVALARSQIEPMLNILSVQLGTLNRMSLSNLAASHAALHSALRDSVDEVKAWVHTEMTTIVAISNKPQAPHHGTVTTNQLAWSGTEAMTFDEVDDPEIRFIEHDTRRTVARYSAMFGDSLLTSATTQAADGSTLTTTNTPKMQAVIAYESKRKYQKAKVTLQLGFKLICDRILKFEIEARFGGLKLGGMPRFGCSMTLINLRPNDAPIFQACRKWDFGEVRYLLETGQASLHDVSSEEGGLLEHVFEGCDETARRSERGKRPESEFQRGLRLLGHLLDLGCDPNAFHKSVSPSRTPAVLSAFEMGYEATVSTMIAHGADLTSFGSTPATLFNLSQNENEITWKIQTLRRSGFSEWKVDAKPNNLLCGACWTSSLEEVLFALEVCRIDPNNGDYYGGPIGNAASRGFLQAVAVLIELGAQVNNGYENMPWKRSLHYSGLLTTTSHYLLSKGANPGLKHSQYDNSSTLAWTGITGAAFEWGGSICPKLWSYTHVEGGLAHLLLHDADQFDIMSDKGRDDDPSWYKRVPRIRAMGIVRAWSYSVRVLLGTWYERSADEWIPDFERAEETRTPRFTSAWSPSGAIFPGYAKKRTTFTRGPRGKERNNQSTKEPAAIENRTVSEHSEGNQTSSRGEGVDSDGHDIFDIGSTEDVDVDDEDVDEDVDDAHWPDAHGLASDPKLAGQPNFFRNATRFYHHISNEEGRRQLSRFPLVRAFCDALQFAGYRADMDDDGDIWYDADGDGDRYFDAREHQPAEERDDWLAKECPICQDFEAFGLGHILAEVEEAMRRLREYREQIKNAKRRYF